MTGHEIRRQELLDRGFSFLEPTEVGFLDGSRATIQADSYLSSKERSDDTPRRRRALKIYKIISAEKNFQPLDELELEQLIGSAYFE
jgi:hypothetical protein